MFNLNKIYSNVSGRFLCNCIFDDEKKAEYYFAKYLMLVREKYFFADLYNKGSVLVIDTPDFEVTKKLATLLNDLIKP